MFSSSSSFHCHVVILVVLSLIVRVSPRRTSSPRDKASPRPSSPRELPPRFQSNGLPRQQKGQFYVYGHDRKVGSFPYIPSTPLHEILNTAISMWPSLSLTLDKPVLDHNGDLVDPNKTLEELNLEEVFFDVTLDDWRMDWTEGVPISHFLTLYLCSSTLSCAALIPSPSKTSLRMNWLMVRVLSVERRKR